MHLDMAKTLYRALLSKLQFRLKPNRRIPMTKIGFGNSSRPNEKEIKAEGHLIDSMILTKIWDRIMELGGDFETLEFRVGKHKTDTSFVRMVVKGRSPEHLEGILEEIYPLGAVPVEVAEAVVVPAPANMVFPDNFYSTTNNPTQVYFNGEWIDVKGIMMDKVIVVNLDAKRAY